MIALTKTLKYMWIGRITIRNQLAYIVDFLVRSLFLLLILYIFLQLWRTTYAGEGSSSIAGFTFRQLMWYLIVTESMTLACPSLCTRLEEEVKSGDVAFKLARPVNFLAYYYVEYMSEAIVRFGVNAVIGGTLGLLLLGPPHSLAGFVWLPVTAFAGFSLNFMLNMCIALSAFWVEETRGLEFVYNKFLFTVGGMLMPIELFPDVLQRIVRWLPLQGVVYTPAKTAVALNISQLPVMLLMQLGWIALFGVVAALIYRRGVTKLHVNGG
ncbi:ABC transporter permease [Paenibacillus ferrarius]|uniref:ABC transporter permease n=1 Tax=Paenibacillus ferrarius TaxID=1469647 RepID=UPI003D2B37C9